MSNGEIVHSVNIMIAILIFGVFYLLYMIFKLANEEMKEN